MALWMSVAAETVIRSAENSDFIANYSKPHLDNPKGENQDYKGIYPFWLLSIQFVVMAGYSFLAVQIPDWFGIAEHTFHGQLERGSNGFKAMIGNWVAGISNHSIAIALVASFAMRVVIYKRSHKS